MVAQCVLVQMLFLSDLIEKPQSVCFLYLDSLSIVQHTLSRIKSIFVNTLL